MNRIRKQSKHPKAACIAPTHSAALPCITMATSSCGVGVQFTAFRHSKEACLIFIFVVSKHRLRSVHRFPAAPETIGTSVLGFSEPLEFSATRQHCKVKSFKYSAIERDSSPDNCVGAVAVFLAEHA